MRVTRACLAGDSAHHHHQQHGDAVVTPNTVRAAIAVLLRNRHFMVSAVAFGLGTGVFYGWSTVLVQLAELYGIGELEAGQIGFAMISVGLIGAIGVGFILPRFIRSHALLLRLSLLVATVATAYFMASLELEWPVAHAFIAASLFGVAVTALVPIAIELGTEVTFPVSSDFSAGFQLVLAQIVGIVLIIILTVLLDNKLTIEALIVLVALCALAALLSLFVRVVYTRLDLDSAKKSDKNIVDEHHQHHDLHPTSTAAMAAAVASIN
jgi:MFS family permease